MTQGAGLVLGIETATPLGGVALAAPPGDLLGECTLRNHESHSERILPALESLLGLLGLTLRDIDAIAVSRGPGSFTGLRSGIASAKGLAFSLGVSLFGVSTLEALAANAPPGTGPVCAVLNARRREVFRAHFSAGPTGPVRRGPDALVSIEALAAELPPGCLVVGEIPAPLPPPASAAQAPHYAPAHLGHPRAATIAALGCRALGESRDSELATLLPFYLRPCDAVPARAKA